jgi:hypothetical protein
MDAKVTRTPRPPSGKPSCLPDAGHGLMEASPAQTVALVRDLLHAAR